MNIVDEYDAHFISGKRYLNSMRFRKKIIKKILMGIAVFSIFVFACIKGPSVGSFLTVLSERCSGCRQCATVCNADAIYFVGNKAVIDPTKCIECLKCVDACPKDAIH